MLDRNNSDRQRNPDNGGNLTLRKSLDIRNDRDFRFRQRTDIPRRWYEGPLYPSRQSTDGISGNDSPPIVGEDVLFSKGATLVSKALPTAPSASVGIMLAELVKDGLPRATISTLKSLRNSPRGAADDFLNFQFGWKPLIGDIRDLIAVLRNHNKIIAQYARDSGRPVRRRRSLPSVRTTEILPGNIPFLSNDADLGGMFGRGAVEITDQVETWFSGEFVYELPIRDSVMNDLLYYERLADKLLGLSLTPELLWELTPWSWLVDWVTNVGDVMSNVTAFVQHGMVMPYGYVQHRVTREYKFVAADIVFGSSNYSREGSWPTPITRSRRYVHMYRRKANPYGFGMTWDGLSKTQLAILAALGLSRGKRDD